MSASVCTTGLLAEASVAAGFCAGVLPVSIAEARSVVAIGATDFLALERGTNSVVVGEDLDGDGIPESVRTLVSADGLNHGLAVTTTHLYASRDTEVYRWGYDASEKTITGPQELVIENMNADGNGGAPGGHKTRTLAIRDNELYVSVGSFLNIDADSYRSRIRRFSIDPAQFPYDFQNGEVFADGIRNEVGMEFDSTGVLWGVGNSADNLVREDLEIDYNDNPGEEVHRFDVAGLNFGYPYCWREYEMESGMGRGTSWAWPDFLLNGTITDAECQTNYDTPVLVMQAHSAPLGITFYQYQESRPSVCDGVEPFPEELDGDAFVAFHGSWNRDIPTGYKVVRLPITPDKTGVVGGIGADPIDFLFHEGPDAQWTDGFRPVDVSFDECGRLLVSSDGSRNVGDYAGSKIVRIEAISSLPTAAPVDAAGLGECEFDCDTDLECQTGLQCADEHKEELQGIGLDPRKAYCGSNVGRKKEEVCYNVATAIAMAPSPSPPTPVPVSDPTPSPTSIPTPSPIPPSPSNGILGLCEFDCDFDSDCADGLLCADAHKAELVAKGYDSRTADCPENQERKRKEEVCFVESLLN